MSVSTRSIPKNQRRLCKDVRRARQQRHFARSRTGNTGRAVLPRFVPRGDREAKERCKNLIVTHHPAIFFPVSNILRSDPLGARLIACLEAGIGVISMHLNCDCARGGIDENLALALGAEEVPAPQEPLEEAATAEFFPSKSRRSPPLRSMPSASFAPPAPSCTARGAGKSGARRPFAARVSTAARSRGQRRRARTSSFRRTSSTTTFATR